MVLRIQPLVHWTCFPFRLVNLFRCSTKIITGLRSLRRLKKQHLWCISTIHYRKKSLNKNLVKQIARLRKSEDAELRIISKAVQQQGNGYDCGIFAIAFATDIAYNHKPEQRTYNQSVMRKYLLAQLENETMIPFPQQTKRVKRVKEVTYRFPLFCKYRVPFFEDDWKEDKGVFMAFCSVCGEWHHKRCENIPVAIFRDEKKAAVWKCLKCK